MKRIEFFIIIFISFSTSIIAQNINNPSYDANCNLWRMGNNSIDNHNGYPNVLFNWQYVVAQAPEIILDVFFIDSLNGWAGHTNKGGLKTTNSGYNWESFTFPGPIPTGAYEGIFFLNQNTGWYVGAAFEIRKTTNGGVNWFRQIPPPIAGIAHSVYFFNADTGIIVGSKNYPYEPCIAKTINGGNNWLEITPSISGHELNQQFWFNENTGWIAGYNILLYTSNGGTTFSNLYSNIPPTSNGHCALLGIQFVNSQTGWIGAANLDQHNIYKTTNGGANWFFQNNPVSQLGWNQINDVRFISSDTGWAAHGTPGSGAIMFTSNGGTNWQMDNTQNSWYTHFETYGRSKIWCGGSEGRIWYALLDKSIGISIISSNLPEQFILFQNYPNPFNPTTNLEFGISKFGFVSLKIFDMLGKEIATLVNESLNPGTYKYIFDGSKLTSGIYYYKLESGNFSEVKKMIYLK